MVKLNSNLRKTLAIALPFDGSERFMDAIEEASPDFRGLTQDEFRRYMSELETMGLVRAEYSDDERDDVSIAFTSDATSYFHDSKAEVAKTIGRYLFQLLVGASGGAVVFALGNAL